MALLSEHQLLHGYARVAVPGAAIEPCACGDGIVAISRSDVDVTLAVRTHNATTAHRAWRERRERWPIAAPPAVLRAGAA